MRRLPALLALCGALTTAAAAQERRGPEFSLGLGTGAIRVNCDNCGGADFSAAGVSQISALWPVGNRVLLGAALVGAGTGSQANETDFAALSAELRWAPNLGKGFTMRAGYGIAVTESELTDTTGARFVNDLTGMLVSVGAGWRFPISKRFALEPGVRSYIVAWGSVRVEPEPFLQNIITTNFAVMVTVSYR
jgi:hypothetical protein